ncbi:MAG: hypothetical protein EOP11_15695, partial [Proteobacteria bacterium]
MKPVSVSVLLAVSIASLACASHLVSSRLPSNALSPPLFTGEVWGPEEDALAKKILDSSIETARK